MTMSKHIDERLLMDLADQVGFSSSAGSANTDRRSTGPMGSKAELHRQAQQAFESMKGKSDREILSEIMNLKRVLQKNPGAYEKQIRAVKSLRGMMNPEQRQRLDQVLRLLEE